jgi:hypothetical protein
MVAQRGSASVGWEMELTAGVHLIERDKRERDQFRRHEPKRKMYFYGDTIDTRARWPARKASTCGGREAGGAGWAKGQVGW